jgi:hypothetical protein
MTLTAVSSAPAAGRSPAPEPASPSRSHDEDARASHSPASPPEPATSTTMHMPPARQDGHPTITRASEGIVQPNYQLTDYVLGMDNEE